MVRAYYNDHDKDMCAWLEQLIRNGDITKGDVDDRSITEIQPSDIAGYDRVHFFAGIGTWDFALNRAGWGDRPIWTASLPCQPFSAAGKGRGKEDERHLLPAYLELVKKCRPNIQIGEQVERAIGHGWLDDLQAVMEAEGYAIGHCVLGAHSVNAAHIRQRLYWVAHSEGERCGETGAGSVRPEKRESGCCWLGNPKINTFRSHNGESISSNEQQEQARGSGISSGIPDAGSERFQKQPGGIKRLEFPESEQMGIPGQSRQRRTASDLEWIFCRDEKYRPVEPGIFPLADGSTRAMVYRSYTIPALKKLIENFESVTDGNNTQEARTMRLKGYGNAIQAKTAEAFIRAFMSI